MRWSDLIAPFAQDGAPCGAAGDPELAGVAIDSRRVGPAEVFVAIVGERFDGHRFLDAALAAGACAVVGSDEAALGGLPVPALWHPNPRAILGPLAAAVHGFPSRAVDVVGVTGTNGKTTSVRALESIAQHAGRHIGSFGTLGARLLRPDGVPPLPLEADALTTPEASDLQALLARVRDAGGDLAVMEVSSHGLEAGRVEGIDFRAAAFTNLSRDHLDTHGTMARYGAIKASLVLDHLRRTDRALGAVINLDDEFGRELAERARSAGVRVLGTSRQPRPGAQCVARDVVFRPDGLHATLSLEGTQVAIEAPLIGEHNLENLLIAAACAHLLGLPADAIAQGLAALDPIPGRLEPVPNDLGALVVVDYAHTPDALARVLAALRAVTAGRIICVFGCGGDRDRDKRPEMGAVVARHADVAVVTSDNPRSEDPVAIIDAVVAGMKAAGSMAWTPDHDGFIVEEDRRVAITRGVALASDGDTVLVAGKGHERYQERGGERVAFSDRDVAAAACRARAAGGAS